ncbi:hypothetical protein LXL04_007343 [Taraxacum kok-saghyz]
MNCSVKWMMTTFKMISILDAESSHRDMFTEDINMGNVCNGTTLYFCNVIINYFQRILYLQNHDVQDLAKNPIPKFSIPDFSLLLCATLPEAATGYHLVLRHLLCSVSSAPILASLLYLAVVCLAPSRTLHSAQLPTPEKFKEINIEVKSLDVKIGFASLRGAEVLRLGQVSLVLVKVKPSRSSFSLAVSNNNGVLNRRRYSHLVSLLPATDWIPILIGQRFGGIGENHDASVVCCLGSY